MNMESSEEKFNCPRLGFNVVKISKPIFPHQNYAGDEPYIDLKGEGSIHCDSVTLCGIIDENGKYNWDECAYYSDSK